MQHAADPHAHTRLGRCLNPNAGDTGGLLLNDWVSPNQAKLDLLHPLHSSSIPALLRGAAAFPCSQAEGNWRGDREPRHGNLELFRCGDGGPDSLCIPYVLRCNGVWECPDHTDEAGCDVTPCVTTAGPEPYAACRLPFFYNGKSFRTCTRMDAETGEAWCPTDVDTYGAYNSFAHSGLCGPGCPMPPADEDIGGLCGSDLPDPNRHCAPPPSPPPIPPSPLSLVARLLPAAKHSSTFLWLGAIALFAITLAAVGQMVLRRERGIAGLAADWEVFARKATQSESLEAQSAGEMVDRLVGESESRQHLKEGASVIPRSGGARKAPGPEVDAAEWWYLDAQDQQIGPLPSEALRTLHAADVLTKETLVWSEDLSGAWQELQAVPSLAPPGC